jgi:pyruvate dehydrogenase (quinone)
MSKSNIADLVVAAIKQAGVKRVYGIAGDSLNALTESIRKDKDIDWIHVRHEEVAAFAAGRLRRELRAGQPAPDQRPL